MIKSFVGLLEQVQYPGKKLTCHVQAFQLDIKQLVLGFDQYSILIDRQPVMDTNLNAFQSLFYHCSNTCLSTEICFNFFSEISMAFDCERSRRKFYHNLFLHAQLTTIIKKQLKSSMSIPRMRSTTFASIFDGILQLCKNMTRPQLQRIDQVRPTLSLQNELIRVALLRK
mmetsp:Transcript_17791/g.26634  ORF Transcript_17791/g.26634 Transcript_17791/m.26634 type:complete len:170 (-) Transcript_17791:561-1070(-)